MKTWLIVGLLAGTLCQVVAGQATKPTANQGAGKPEANQPPKSGTLVANLSTEPHTETKQETAEPQTQNCWDWLSSPTASNWALVVVGTVGIIVAICTLKIIERQTKATEIAAEAAKTNADALINSERAWIFVTIGPPPDLSSEPGKVTIPWVIPEIKNYGRTPATITKMCAAGHMIDKDLPPEPDYANFAASSIGDIILPPNIKIPAPKVGIDTSKFESVRVGNAFLYIYGYVDYLDFAKRSCRTRFCYKYHVQSGFDPFPSGFYIGGPPAYNRAT